MSAAHLAEVAELSEAEAQLRGLEAKLKRAGAPVLAGRAGALAMAVALRIVERDNLRSRR